MQAGDESPVMKDAERAVSIAGRVFNYYYVAMVVLALACLGLVTFLNTKGSGLHRTAVTLGYVTLFGVVFGLIFAWQYALRLVLRIFFNAGMAALSQRPDPSAAGDTASGAGRPLPTTEKDQRPS
jgi:hypothetical protein